MKKTMFKMAMVMTLATMLSLVIQTENEVITTPNHIQITTHLQSQGKHCSGTVGCDCSGFSPITDGKEWQKAYCKKCGHKKSVHK